MKLNKHQRDILEWGKNRDALQDGYDDVARDRTTDAERTYYAGTLAEVEYDEDYNRRLAEVL